MSLLNESFTAMKTKKKKRHIKLPTFFVPRTKTKMKIVDKQTLKSQ